MNFLASLDKWASLRPDAVALQDMDHSRKFTYQQLRERSMVLAGHLATQQGIAKGDRVAVLAPNEVDTVLLLLACMRLEAVLVPLNWRLTARELSLVMSDCAPKLLFVHESCAELATKLNQVKQLSFESLRTSLGEARHNLDLREASTHLPCLILYTSGTTGAAKGVVLSQETLFWNAVSTGMRLEIRSSDTCLIFHPFFHTSGWNVLTTPFLFYGARVLFLQKFDADRVLQICESPGLSILFGVPTMMNMMAERERFASADFSRTRFAIVGGEPLGIPLIEKWQSKGVAIRQGYGLTEFGPNVFSLSEKDSIRKRGSIGFPNHFIEAKLVDGEGREVNRGETGELWLKGRARMLGYWNKPEESGKVFEGEWLKTGDLLRQDDEGYFFVLGRKKDMFISGGENVYPAEVEQFIATHPSVSEVAVVGVKDERWGEVGRAYIVAKDNVPMDERELREFCLSGLARYKVPKTFAFLASLPKSESGKLLKRALTSL